MLLEVYFGNMIWYRNILKFIFEQCKDFFGHQLLMLFVGYSFCSISHSLPHLCRQIQSIILLEDIAYAALSGLAVNTDNICLIMSADVRRIDRKIRHCPFFLSVLFSVFHTFCDRILMRSRESSKYKRSAVRATHIDRHTCIFLICLTDCRHISKIQFRIHTLRIHIHRQSNNIHITCSLTVSKQCSLYPVCSCQNTHLGI